MARHIKKGDNVLVLAGKYKGQQGKVLEVLIDKNRVRVEGIAGVKRHLRPGADPKRPEGGIIDKTGSLHISNVLPVDPASGKATRVGYKFLEDGKKVRFARKSGDILTGSEA